MRIDNYNAIENEVKIWFGIDLCDSLKQISTDGCFDKNLNKIVNYYNENSEESLRLLRKCIHEIKIRLLEKQYNCKLNGEHGYNIIKTIKDYDLNQLGDSLNFSIWLKQELYNAGVGSFYDICWGIGGSCIGNKSSGYDTLDSLELTVRSYNALKRAGINTIDELRKLSIDELRNIRNLGQKCFEEIVSKLADKGYVLSDESDEGSNNVVHTNAKPINLSDRCRDEIIKRFDALGIMLKI